MLKELLTHSGNASHRHHSQFVDTLNALDKESGGLGHSLLKQLEWVMTESPPNREGAFTENCLWSWAHFNLREQSELLQLNLLFLHSGIADPDTSIKTFKKYFMLFQVNSYKQLVTGLQLYDWLNFFLFQEHAFGHKLESSHASADVNSDLVESIGLLESLLLVYLIDLPSVSVRSPDHAMSVSDSADPDMAKVERMVAGLGSQPEHGPVMLAWMLAKYMLSEEDRSILSKYHAMGERAVQLRALNVLTRAATNTVLSSHTNLHSVVRGICYALLAVLSTSFDLQQMGLTSDGLTLTLDLLQVKFNSLYLVK